MRKWLALAAKLYPKAWRERYHVEFACLLEDVAPRWSDVGDVVRGAMLMQLRMWSSYLKLIAAVVAASALVAIGVSFTMPKEYVSSASVEDSTLGGADNPEALDRITRMWQDVVSRSGLSELIQRPTLDLYQRERHAKPLEDVIEEMKKDLRIDILKAPAGGFRVSFAYPDPVKAQSVVNAVTAKIVAMDGTRRVADSASLPRVPLKPNRLTFVVWGLGTGLVVGLITSLLRWRPWWSMKVMGFGLAGCAVATLAFFLIPDRYTSSGMLRVVVSGADGVRHFMRHDQFSNWLRSRKDEVLSDASLSEVIQRPSIRLYDFDSEQQSIQPVIARMRREVSIEPTPLGTAFTVSFTYPDRMKAQRVVSALITKLTDLENQKTAQTSNRDWFNRAAKECFGLTSDRYWKCVQGYFARLPVEATPKPAAVSIELLDPASLPETPAGPNRWIPAIAGLAAGLVLGAYGLRWKTTVTLQTAVEH